MGLLDFVKEESKILRPSPAMNTRRRLRLKIT
ncbi:hypothetical protein J2Y91_004281 [Erwinia aphidicola]|nr:hypothetical protein [Erwinia aphidicola]